MFEVGNLIARITLEGLATFSSDAAKADRSLAKIGSSATGAGKGVDELGTKTTRSTQAVKAAGDQAEQTAKSTSKVTEATKEAGKSTSEAGKATEDATGKAKAAKPALEDVHRGFLNMSDGARAASREIGQGMALVGTAILGVAAVAVKSFADYQHALSAVGAATGANEAQLNKLGAAALNTGKQFGFSAVEALSGEEALSKAGVSLSAIMGGALAGSLTLAAAGQIKVGDAADLAAVAMTQFKLSGKDVPHIADLIAAGAGKAVGDVSDLGLALKQSGLVASQFGLSLEDTVGTLAAFASNGLLGSDAGTSFKQMLLSLAAPSKQASGLMKDLGINAYDASGQFIGITQFAEVLRQKLGKLTEQQRQNALAQIFGSDAIRAANILYDQGGQKLQDWIDKTNDQGYAADQAAKRLDNLTGDVGKLTAAFQGDFIKSGSGVNEVLRNIVHGATDLLNAFGNLPPEMQSTVFVIGLVTAGVLLLAGALLIGIPRVVAFRESISTLNKDVPALGKGLGSVSSFLGGPWGIALAAAIALGGAFADQVGRASARSKELTGTLDQQTGAITRNTKENIAAKLAQDGTFDAAKRAGVGQKELLNAITGSQGEYEKTTKKLTDYYGAHSVAEGILHPFSGGVIQAAGAVGQERRAIELSKEAHENTSKALEGTKEATDETTTGFVAQADAVRSSTELIQDLIDKLNESNGIQITAGEAQIAYGNQLSTVAERIQKAREGVDGFAISMDQSTQAGRDNYSSLFDLASAAQEVADKNLKAGGTVESYRAELESSRGTFLQNATDLLGNADAAQALTDKIFAIPPSKEIQMILDTAAAAASLDRFVRNASGRQIAIPLVLNQSGVDAFRRQQQWTTDANGGVTRYYAGGGFNESHVAQIAQAGATRVWAEPETMGEAYIPLSPAKRARSTEILADVADRFGMDLVARTPGGSALSGTGTSGSSRGTTAVAIRGTLDLGNGLVGMVEGIIENAFDSVATELGGGSSL